MSAVEQDAVCGPGTALADPEGLFKRLTKMVIEVALDEEMSEHLGHDKGVAAGRNKANSRNGNRSKTVNADPVTIDVSRDLDGSFDLGVVKKRAHRLS